MPAFAPIAAIARRLLLAGSLPLLLLAPPMALAETDATEPDATEPANAATAALRGADDHAALPPEHVEARQGTVVTAFFAFDRAELTPASRRALDALAPRIRAHLEMGGQVLIEGHSDATGHAGYNLDLSERRVRAVAAFLRDARAIPPQRLRMRAWGASDPRRPDAPGHAENRRVEITLIAPHRPCRPGVSLHGQMDMQPGRRHLDIDDFGGAMSPLPFARPDFARPDIGRIITMPAPQH